MGTVDATTHTIPAGDAAGVLPAIPGEQGEPKGDPVPDDRDTEALWKIYQVVSEWVRFADTKAAAVLAANVGLVVVAVDLIKDNVGTIGQDGRVYVIVPLLMASVGALVLSGYWSVSCLSPRVAAKGQESLIFFQHIARRELDDYRKVARTLSRPEVIVDDLAQQVWNLSKVADAKHGLIRRAVRGFAVALLTAVAAVVLLVL